MGNPHAKVPVKYAPNARQWWRTPLISALEKQGQVHLCEFEASLVYRVSSRTDSKATQRNPVWKNQ